MVEIRKLITMREIGPLGPRGHGDAAGCARGWHGRDPQPLRRTLQDDLRRLFEAGAMLGERLMPELVKLLDGRPSPTARVQSSASTARWIKAVPASIQCLAGRCVPRSAAVRQ